MGKYVQLGAVKTWYDEHGAGQPLVLLHGGLVDARFFEPKSRAAGGAVPRLHTRNRRRASSPATAACRRARRPNHVRAFRAARCEARLEDCPPWPGDRQGAPK
jgi:pimeloyl-ACP methyl ester carboxylesterase